MKKDLRQMRRPDLLSLRRRELFRWMRSHPQLRRAALAPAGVEELETRRLLASAVVQGTTLNITGDDVSETITVVGNTVHINAGTFNIATDFHSVVVNANGGNDRVDLSQIGAAIPSTIRGGAGNDTLIGGIADDTLDGGSGADDMSGGQFGNDTADYSARTANLVIGLGSIADDGEAGEHDNVRADIETVIGGSGNDSISGTGRSEKLIGNAGNDTLRGGFGDDTLDGGAGADLLDGGGGTGDAATNDGSDTVINVENVTTTGGGADAHLDSGKLIVTGTAGADNINILGDGSSVHVTINGAVDQSFSLSGFFVLQIDALGGNDNIHIEGFSIGDGSGYIDLSAGAGDDVVLIKSVAFPRLAGYAFVRGDAGNDRLMLQDLDWQDGQLSISGGEGNDSLFGSDSRELLQGDGGNDSLNGGGGNDTLDGGSGGDTLKGGAGLDTLDYSARTGNLTIGPGTLADDGEAREHDNVATDVETILGGSGNDSIKGTGGDNLLIGNGGNDTLLGLDGNDTLEGDAGADRLDGAGGDDTARNDANDTLISIEHSESGGGGDRTAILANGVLTITGSDDGEAIGITVNDAGALEVNIVGHVFTFDVAQVNSIIVNERGGPDALGISGRDGQLLTIPTTVNGGEGNDTVDVSFADNISFNGDNGDDSLDVGEQGGALINGGDGDDSALVHDGGTGDIEGGAGTDSYANTFYNPSEGYSLLPTTENASIVVGDLTGNDLDNILTVTIYGSIDGGGGNDQIHTGGDSFFGSTIHGGAGNDTVFANGSNREIYGDAGNDVFVDAGGNSVFGGDGNDTLDFSASTENLEIHLGVHVSDSTFYAGDIETVLGGSGNDRIVGTSSKNLLIGNGGNDTLDGGTSGDAGDTLNGGDGTDVGVTTGGDTLISIESTNDPGDFYFANADTADELFVIGTANADNITVTSGPAAGTFTVSINGNTRNFNYANVGAVEIQALGGNDSVTVSDPNVFVQIHGNGGNDTLLGGNGGANLYGDEGNDSLVGGTFDDYLNGGAGADVMKGGAGNDTVDYSDRTANLMVGIGTLADDGEAGEGDNVYLDVETVLGGSGNDTIKGGDANNLLVGNGGNDSIKGNYGDDTLDGGAGADTLNGEAGDDTAITTPGDVLIGIEHSS